MTRRTQIVLASSCALMLLGLLGHYWPVFLYGLVFNHVAHRPMTLRAENLRDML